jgi:hypothetical protein
MAVQEVTFTDGSEAGAVADHYFTVAEFRAFDTDFSSVTDFPDAKVEDARAWAEARFEEAAWCAWVERTGQVSFVGDGRYFAHLSHRDIRAVTAVTVGGTALTAAELADLIVYPTGMVKRTAGWDEDELVVITYTYGKTSIPDPVKDAIMILTRFRMTPSNLADNAVSESTGTGFIRISHATPGGKTGVLEVDAVAADFGHARVVIG